MSPQIVIFPLKHLFASSASLLRFFLGRQKYILLSVCWQFSCTVFCNRHSLLLTVLVTVRNLEEFEAFSQLVLGVTGETVEVSGLDVFGGAVGRGAHDSLCLCHCLSIPFCSGFNLDLLTRKISCSLLFLLESD